MSWKEEWLKPTWLVTMACAMLGVWQASLGRRESHEAKQDAKSAVDGVLEIGNGQAALSDSVHQLYIVSGRMQGEIRLLKVAVGSSGGQRSRGSERARRAAADSGSVGPPSIIASIGGGIANGVRSFWHAIGGG